MYPMALLLQGRGYNLEEGDTLQGWGYIRMLP